MSSRKQNPNLPIYALNVLGSRMYIVTSPTLAVAIQRNAKTLSFLAYGAKFASTVCQLSADAETIMNTNVRGEDPTPGFGQAFTNTVHANLALGRSLDQLIHSTIQGIGAAVNGLSGTSTIQLGAWLRRTLTLAAMDAVYGPTNPLKSDAMYKAYCDFETGLTSLLLTPFPRLFARRAVAGRRAITDALTEYLRSDAHRNGSEYIQTKYVTCTEHGMPLEDTAKLDLGGLTGLNSNAGPATFWFVFFVFSRPALLRSIREEIAAVLLTCESEGDLVTHTLDVTKLKEKCPLFVSTYQEILRMHSLGATVRLVLQDTILQDRYLLKKDGVVMIPAAAVHSDPSVYGPTAGEFDAYRFMKKGGDDGNSGKYESRIPKGAYRAFGGGTSLCPGRHLAVTEILTFVALLVMRFEMTPANAVDWKVPEPDQSNMATAVPAPKGDILVEVRAREGWERCNWELVSSKLKEGFDIAAVSI